MGLFVSHSHWGLIELQKVVGLHFVRFVGVYVRGALLQMKLHNVIKITLTCKIYPLFDWRNPELSLTFLEMVLLMTKISI
jgi:hypothetical protein